MVNTVVSAPATSIPTQVDVSSRRERARSREAPGWPRLFVADAVAVAGCTALVQAVHPSEDVNSRLAWSAITTLAFMLALAAFGSYTRYAQGSIFLRRFAGSGVWQALPLGVVLAVFAGEAGRSSTSIERPELAQAGLVALLALVAIPAARLLVPFFTIRRLPVQRVLILGTGRVAERAAARLQRRSDVFVVGFVDDDRRDVPAVLGTSNELPEICARNRVDVVVVTFGCKPVHETLESLRLLHGTVSVWVVPRLYELVSWRSRVEELDGIPLLDVAPARTGPVARVSKRIFDIIVAGILMVILSPIFAAVAIAIKLDSPGPVMFRQLRSGRQRVPFRMYKFRTMGQDAEQQRAALADCNEVDGPIFKMKGDPRVTSVGQWLRRTSLDELPQLINVLRGEMSLVGPRPFPIEESDQITGWATIRFSVPPGMTGLWQVSGRNALDYEDLRHLDYVYVASWSFGWDLRILLHTPASVLSARGVL